VLKTADSASPTVSTGTVATSLAVFTVLYGALAVVEFLLTVRYAKAGPPSEDEVLPPPSSDDSDSERSLAFAY
jgi:cytochrome d ubiquinol oxidase subunit I